MALAQLLIACLALTKFSAVAAGVDQLDTKPFQWEQSGAVGKSKIITLTFWVKMTHTHDLKDILSRVSDPKSAEYGHYMSKAQVDALTKPAQADISAVKTALKGYDTHSQNADAVISADVPVSFAQELLGGEFVHLCHPSVDGTSEKVCEMRNPTAKVPPRLRQACDIISPIDDPLPPIRPFPGPIIEPVHPSRAFLVVNEDESKNGEPTSGCCFSIGYGAMTKPCCLTTDKVQDVAKCGKDRRTGGSSGYTVGECPTSADQAALHLQKHSTHDDVAATGFAEPSKRVGASAPPQSGPVALATSEKKGAGCCFSLGYGGPMMRPCCLKATSASDVSNCEVDDKLGGSASYSLGECPASAAAAARIIEGQKLEKQTKEVLNLKEKLEGKEVEELKVQPNLTLSQLSTAGCCFSLGYGSMMKPCCLETQRVSDVSSCKREPRMGGASSHSLGNCPTDADDAAKIVAAKPKVPAHASTHPTSIPEKQSHAARGCCYSFGEGAHSKPCCLEAQSTHDVGACNVQRRVGGASGYTYGACPEDAQEAAHMFASQSGESAMNGKGESTSSGTTTLIVVFVVGCGGVLAGLFIAAKRRPDWRSTPFLHDNGAE